MDCSVFKCSKTAMSSSIPFGKNTPSYNLADSIYSIRIFDKLESIQSLWSAQQPNDNIFLQTNYLLALEQYMPSVLQPLYIIFYEGNKAIGLSYMQIYQVNVAESIQKKPAANTFYERFKASINYKLLQIANVTLLVSGNLLLTGQYGYAFNAEIAVEKQFNLMNEALSKTTQVLKNTRNQKIQLHFLKDFAAPIAEKPKAFFESKNYLGFMMQPGFKIALRPHWKNFEDYLSDMQSKYRVRAKRAQKKAQAIEKRELNLEEIKAYLPKIHELYLHIAQGAIFNGFVLHDTYFLGLKEYLKDNFKLVAYFLNGELVAFYTAIFNHGELEAHFLGVSHSHNHEYQIYLNILYDLIQMGIYHGCKQIDFARTAPEIKTSVGAVATDFYCFIKHNNPLLNPVAKWGINRFMPEENWESRHPFKEEQSEGEKTIEDSEKSKNKTTKTELPFPKKEKDN